MKTFKKLFSGAMMIMLFALLLTSCSDTPASIEIKQMPSATFEVGTTDINPLMIVKVGNTDGTTTDNVKLNYADGKVTSDPAGFEVTLEGFKLDEVGTFTASVQFGGAVSYFDYQVVATDNLFAGGDGSSKNPYQITTAEQFLNMGSVTNKDKYFKIMNDIDMGNVTSKVAKFQGKLNGNNKRLYNVKRALINRVYNGYIENLQIFETEACAFNALTGTTTLKNVDTYGYITSQNNASAYAGYVGLYVIGSSGYRSTTNLTLIDCDNHVDIIGQGDKVAAYFAFTYAGLRSLTMENCHNYGHIEGDKAAFVSANSFDANAIKLTMTNCTNEGKFVQVNPDDTTKSVIACTSNPDKVLNFNENNLNATKEFVELLFDKNVGTTNKAKYATLKVVEDKYVLEKNAETTSTLDVAYIVVSLVVPVRSTDGGFTHRPNASSNKLYFDENGQLELGLLSTAYTRENSSTPTGSKLFNADWLYCDGTKLIFNPDGYTQAGYEFNNEAPYFVLYAYNSADELIAGSTKVSLNVQ